MWFCNGQPTEMRLINRRFHVFGGGIHPPADDMPGRLIGAEVGQDAFAHAESYFSPEGTR